MIARRLTTSVIAVLAIVGCAWLSICASASAQTRHEYLGAFAENIGPPSSLAVDDSTGDVYVFEGFSSYGHVFKFNAAGEPANFAATGTNSISATGNGSRDRQQIAVDNSSGPAKGDIYVTSHIVYGPPQFEIFSSSGELLGVLHPGSGSSPGGEPCGVTVDKQGNLYIGLQSGYVAKYVPKANPVTDSDYVASLNAGGERCQLAADAEGNVLSAEQSSGSVIKYEPMQFGALQASGTLLSSGINALAVDLSTNLAYLDTGSELHVYDSAGQQVERLQPEAGSQAAFGASESVAVNGATHEIYVTDNAHGRVDIFGPGLVVPDVTTSPPGLTTTAVTLKGVVNPDGIPANCYFEYGTSTSYGQTAPCSTSPGAGSSPVEVSAELTGLEPGKRYHARLVATNENGSNLGEDVTFALPLPPSIDSESAASVSISTVTIEATIRSMGYETTFHVEYGTDTSYGATTPIPDADVGSLGEAKVVRQLLSGLSPDTTYHYRIVAKNVNGVTEGPDQTFTTFGQPQVGGADTCPNAAYRTGLSVSLPDCRTYEMVTPPDKYGGEVSASHSKETQMSVSGDSVAFTSRTGFGESKGAGLLGFESYVATRGPNGWHTKGIDPTPGAADDPDTGAISVLSFSDELDRAALYGGDLAATSQYPTKVRNFYLEDTATTTVLEKITRFEGTEQTINPNVWIFSLSIGAGSSDLGLVTFESRYDLVPQVEGQPLFPKAYALDHGHVKLVGILPDGTAPFRGSALVRGFVSLAENQRIAHPDTVSRDGSRILFVSPAFGEQQLYMRKNATSTVLVSESELSEPTTAEDVHFQGATPDGTKVLFTTTTQLTSNDPGGSGTALYEYTDGPDPAHEPNLTFIARADFLAGYDELPANAGHAVAGLSDDGNRIYFSAFPSSTLPFETDSLALFLWDSGHIRQVAPQPATGGLYGAPIEPQVSPDGRQIAYLSSTGGAPSIYVYDEETNSLRCASCSQNGAAVTTGVEENVTASAGVGANYTYSALIPYFSRNGKYVFFNTEEALVPQDTNKLVDAYEYDTANGTLSLLSTGSGEFGTWFVGTSASGRDAFLVTRQKLNGWDPDKLTDLYDARIGGDLPEPPPPRTPCAGDECQGIPSAVPGFNTASEFVGAGNPTFEAAAKAKAKPSTRTKRLRHALARCREKRSRRRRAACEAAARRRYGSGKSAKRAARAGR